jgi:hypothetical protein
VLPLRKCMGSTGVIANSAGAALMAATRHNRAVVREVPPSQACRQRGGVSTTLRTK